MKNEGRTKLQEELCELGDQLAKYEGRPLKDSPLHWDGYNICKNIEDEIGDVLASIGYTVEKMGLNQDRIFGRMFNKQDLYKRWDAVGEAQ